MRAPDRNELHGCVQQGVESVTEEVPCGNAELRDFRPRFFRMA
jgi:hypothetical protein